MLENDKIYPSDLTWEQFKVIRSLLETTRKKTKPREIDLFHVFNAILYLLKTGCQWRTVHEYFTIWRTPQQGQKQYLLEQVLKNELERPIVNRDEKRRPAF